MSMHLDFEPHSWYFEFAIKKDDNHNDHCYVINKEYEPYCTTHGRSTGRYMVICDGYAPKWSAFCEDGMSYTIMELDADTLDELKSKIRQYWTRDRGKHIPAYYYKRLRKSKEAIHERQNN